ncbi:hypothetical protein N7931_19470 [Catenovulum sp. 2E275]|uniref:hypothetical protein n=1 Tax=Catenovulum sp. 2E275 TaxID=2980497 RepID=UPI0021D0DC49|nr:hypothetical protein [Catenovulum sp. 2E275]MCU4677787.1 hypothetical protein [Catenovulum sp. 2E275]
MINLDAIYVDVDDFCLLFEPQWITHLIETGEKQRNKLSYDLATQKTDKISTERQWLLYR